jgi:hypothetical protein
MVDETKVREDAPRGSRIRCDACGYRTSVMGSERGGDTVRRHLTNVHALPAGAPILTYISVEELH